MSEQKPFCRKKNFFEKFGEKNSELRNIVEAHRPQNAHTRRQKKFRSSNDAIWGHSRYKICRNLLNRGK